MTRSFGIIVAYPPTVLSGSQGLARLLIFLIRGCLECGFKVVIICPEWCREDLTYLLNEEGIAQGSADFEIVTPGRIPPVLVIHSAILRLIQKVHRTPINTEFFSKKIEQIKIVFSKIIGSSSWVIVTITLLTGLLLLPLILLIILLSLMKEKMSNQTVIINETVKPVQSKTILKIMLSRIGSPLWAIKDDLFVRHAFKKIEQNEINRLVRLAKEKKGINAWLLHTPFWPNLAKQLQHTVVVCPDVVITEFSIGFLDEIDYFIDRKKVIRDSLYSAEQLITYSDHVKNVQICAHFDIPEKKITVINHGGISLTKSLDSMVPFTDLNKIEQRDFCLQIIHDYLRTHSHTRYLQLFDFSGVRFIMYSSQIRPHKNVPALIRALHRLIHEMNEPIKLILTGSVDNNPEISNLITELGLSYDVLSLPEMPTRVMAAFYHLAQLAVNPTLSEGGFPFTFSEAYSVGTPSIMSRIPVVEEFVIDPELNRKMLFDPYNLEAMVERIHWGLHHREELLNIQQPIFETLKERSWAQVAQEYKKVLDQISA
jgi:glycosyltransferase involved in cell wall biosynthesis